MNIVATAAIMFDTAKIYIGTGNAISATSGAIITTLLLAKLAMPIEVTPKRVGNI